MFVIINCHSFLETITAMMTPSVTYSGSNLPREPVIKNNAVESVPGSESQLIVWVQCTVVLSVYLLVTRTYHIIPNRWCVVCLPSVVLIDCCKRKFVKEFFLIRVKPVKLKC